MQAKKNLLIITDSAECAYSYPKRKSLAEIAHISSDIPLDEILINIEVAFVLDSERPDRISILEELREYAREHGNIQRVIAISSNPALRVEEMLKLAVKVERVGAEFAPQFI